MDASTPAYWQGYGNEQDINWEYTGFIGRAFLLSVATVKHSLTEKYWTSNGNSPGQLTAAVMSHFTSRVRN